MANRFNFVNTGAAAGAGLRDYIQEREMERRQKLAEESHAEEMRLKKSADARADSAAKQAMAQAKIQEAVTKATLARQERADAMKDVEDAGVGGKLEGPAAERVKTQLPFMATIDPGQLESRTMDATTTPFVTEGMTPGPMVEGVSSAGQEESVVSKGTKAQQAIERLKANPKMTPEINDLIEAGVLDGAALARLLVPDSTTDVSWQRMNGTRAGSKELEIFFSNPKQPGVFKDAQGNIVNEKVTPVESQGPAAFYTPIQSGIGGITFDNRSGTYRDAAGRPLNDVPLRETGAQSEARVNNAAAQSQAETLMEEFTSNPEWVGPLAGRFESMQAAYLGNDKEFARFEARTNSLKNRFIKAITGAQMSEPEAVRIMKQLPDVNLPPATFAGRLEVIMEELKVVRELQQQVFSGIRKPSDNPVTEARLSELFPDSNKAPKPGSGTTKSGSGAPPATGGRRQVYDPITGKLK